MNTIPPSTSPNLRLIKAYGNPAQAQQAARPGMAPKSGGTFGAARASVSGEAAGVSMKLSAAAVRSAGELEAKTAAATKNESASRTYKASGASRLVAGVVPSEPGGVAAQATKTPSAAAMPFYRHPADQNAAFTSATAGRILDLNA